MRSQSVIQVYEQNKKHLNNLMARQKNKIKQIMQRVKQKYIFKNHPLKK